MPSPLVGEGYSDFQHGELAEGPATPHPPEYVEIPAMPSPTTRGEGTSAGAIDSILIHPVLVRALSELAPVGRLHASDEFGSAISIRLEDRRLAFPHVEPVLSEGIENVWLVRHEHNVGAGRRCGRGKLLHGGSAAVVLVR